MTDPGPRDPDRLDANRRPDAPTPDGQPAVPAQSGQPAQADLPDHVHRMWAQDRASAALGMTVLELAADHAVVQMSVTEAMVNGHDICHGGYVFTLADSAFALACNSRGVPTVAAGCDITFVAPARRGDLLQARAQVRTAYGRSGLTDVTVSRPADGAVIAEMRGRSRSIPSRTDDRTA